MTDEPNRVDFAHFFLRGHRKFSRAKYTRAELGCNFSSHIQTVLIGPYSGRPADITRVLGFLELHAHGQDIDVLEAYRHLFKNVARRHRKAERIWHGILAKRMLKASGRDEGG